MSTTVPSALSPGSRWARTALSAAFSITRTMMGVAKTGGSIASLNRFARCSGATTSVKLPFAPTGIACMSHLSAAGSTPRNAGARSSWTMMRAASAVSSLPTRSRPLAASNRSDCTSSGERTPFATSLRTKACRMRTSISPWPSDLAFSIIVISRIMRAVVDSRMKPLSAKTLARPSLNIPVQFRERATQTVKLIHQMKNDVDALVIDSEIGFQVLDEMGPRKVHLGEIHFGRGLIGNEPALLEPDIQRLHLETRTTEKLRLAHGHDVLSSRGLNAFPLSHFATNASSSGSGGFGKTTFSLTN